VFLFKTVIAAMKVLFVDDGLLFLELSKTFLKLFYDLISDTVESAGKALEKLEEESYDVVVVDFDMPFMDGIMLLKTIRDRSINVPFILFTGIEKKRLCTVQ
jgi:CheY-like chemotaxis protein